jgi:16S rRNA processing protein RimM
MSPGDPRFLVVGHVARVHGIKGEVCVQLLTDHPEASFASGVVLRLGDASGHEPDPQLPPVRVESVRPFKRGLLVRFGGFDGRAEAERILAGRYLLRESEALEPLAEDEVYYHQLLGCTVETVTGTHLGEVYEVYELVPSDLLEVRGGERTYMIPFRREVVVEVDMDGRRLVVDPPEGLLDL